MKGSVVFREYDLDRALEAIRSIGYEYIETQGTNPWCNHVKVGKDDPACFKEKIKSYGFKGVTALWSKDAALISCGERCKDSVKRTIEWAAAAGIPVVNCGDGYKDDRINEEDAFQILKERLLYLIEIAEKNKVTLAIEPHGSFSLTLQGLKRIMTVSDSQYFGINYDCANVHRSGYVETQGDAMKWIDISKEENEANTLRGIVDRVVHFHAKDLDRDRNCLALGTGEVLVRECMEILKEKHYDGVVSLETEGGMLFEEAKRLAQKSFQFMKETIEA